MGVWSRVIVGSWVGGWGGGGGGLWGSSDRLGDSGRGIGDGWGGGG